MNTFADDLLRFLFSPQLWANAFAFALLALLVVGAVWLVTAMSIGRHVDWNKHRDWEYWAAYKYVRRNSLPVTAGYVALFFAVWFAPTLVLGNAELEEVKVYQFGATFLIWVGSNLSFQQVLNHIRRPPPEG